MTPARLRAPGAPGWILVATAAALVPSPAYAQPALAAEVRVETPRDFGYRAGDLLELRATVRVPEGFALDAEEVGPPDPPEWLETREREWEASESGGWRRYRFRFVYQVFPVPDGVTRLEIPAVPLAFFRAGGEEGAPGSAGTAAIPAFRFTASALTDSTASASPDWRPPPATGRAPKAAGALLVLLLAGWGAAVGWERRRLRAGPLWRARREVRRAAGCGEAILALHRGLEARAGGALFGHDLERLARAWPPAAEAREALEAFFALSRARFFAADGVEAAGGEGACRERLERLARRLADLERAAGGG